MVAQEDRKLTTNIDRTGRVSTVELPDRRLYPAIDIWNEPEATGVASGPEGDQYALAAAEVAKTEESLATQHGEIPVYLTTGERYRRTQQLYSMGESMEHYLRRIKR